jgi:PAS domain S-box-containing protein
LFHDPTRLQNRFFAFFAISGAVWTLAIIVALYFTGNTVFWVRISFAAGSIIPLGILFIFEVFPHVGKPLLSSLTKVFLAIGLLLAVLSFTPYVVEVAHVADGQLRLTYGLAHRWLGLYIVSSIGYGAWLIFQKSRGMQGQNRLQVRYLVMGFLVPAVLATTTNLLIPALFGTSRFSIYGPMFSLLMVLLIAHAIIRHRLMNVRTVIKRGVVYLVAFGAASLILLVLLVVSHSLSPDGGGVGLRDLLLALVVAVLFQPLKARIQRACDRYLYREPWDYQRTLREASRELSATIHLPTLLSRVADVLGKTLRPEAMAIYLLDQEEGLFSRAFVRGDTEAPDTFPLEGTLVAAMNRERKLVFRDELVASRGGVETDPVLADLARLGAEVVVPLLETGRLVGFLAVSAKRSGDPFFSDDEDLLVTLANQSAVAIQNAQAHQQVVQVNEWLQKILGAIDSGVVAVDGRARVRLFNRAAELMTGTAASDAKGRPAAHLPAPLARLVEATLREGRPQPQVELALPDPAGQLVPLMCSTSPLLSLDGLPVGAVAVLSDLSRVKELEEERRRVERLASIEAMASGLVHEIRNPMVAIKTFLQLLPDRHGDASFRERGTRSAGRAIDRIEELLDRCRTLSVASSQPMDVLDVREPLQTALDLLEPQREARGVRLRQVADGPPRAILGNASQLEQLFHNLCLNAIEAMEEGGELTVRVADLSAAGGSTLLVEVSDTGGGVPEERLESIFAPFVSTKARGTGLGLAICRGIADAHRAAIRARNNLGRPGATFTVEFPVHTATPARAAG